jgi:hypothetical protein
MKGNDQVKNDVRFKNANMKCDLKCQYERYQQVWLRIMGATL